MTLTPPEYTPYHYQRRTSGWFYDVYDIYFEDTRVMDVNDFELAHKMTWFLNNAFTLGVYHQMACQ